MNIINLITATKSDPTMLKQLESAITTLTLTDDYTTLNHLLETHNIECQFYVAIILERRLKLIIKDRQRIELFVHFLGHIDTYIQSMGVNMFVNKVGDVYALVGVFLYPFFVDVYAMFGRLSVGHLFYKKFLFAINTNNEITNDRRIELRNITRDRNVAMLECLRCDRTDAIEIYEYALLCLKENDQLVMAVLQVGSEDDETLCFFETYLSMRNAKFITEIVQFVKTKSINFLNAMLEIFVGVKREIYCNIELVKYVVEVFDGSSLHLEYFMLVVKGLRGKMVCDVNDKHKHENNNGGNIKENNERVNVIFYEIMQRLIAMDDKAHSQKVMELMRLINAQYPKIGECVLEACGDTMSVQRVLILLHTYPRKAQIRFNNIIVECYRLLYLDSRDCLEMMESLDMNDAESCRFVAKAIRKFNLDRDRIFHTMTKCKSINSKHTDELTVICLLELEKYQFQQRDVLVAEFLAGGFTLRKRLRLLALLRKDYEIVKGYVPAYFEHFMSTNEVETGFAILGVIIKKAELPQAIYAHLFNNLHTYTLKQLASFITELLTNMNDDTNVLFLDAIYKKMAVDFETANYVDITVCVRSFGNFLEKKIIDHRNNAFIEHRPDTNTIYYNMLINMLNLRDDQAIRKVYEVIKNNNLEAQIDLGFMADIYSTNPHSEVLSLMVYVIENSENPLKASFKGGLKSKKDVIRQYLKQDVKAVNALVDKYNVQCDVAVDVSKFFE